MDGVRIVGDWPASFLTGGGGLNITLKSYLDRMNFGFMGCPEQTGDLSKFVEYMTESLEETLAAAEAYAEAQGTPPARPKRVPPRRRGSGGGRLTAVQAPSAREG